jgi:PAS domain S-box-containing protein
MINECRPRFYGVGTLVNQMAEKNIHPDSDIEDRYRSILEQSPFSIQILSSEGYTLQVNKAWEELWGVTLEQIRDYNILKDRQLEEKGVLAFLRRAFEGESVQMPPVLYDPNESIPGITRYSEPVRWTKGTAYPIKDKAGNVREVVLIHEDITSRMFAEEKVRLSEERYRSLLENANDIIYSHDLNGVYLSINSAGERITGYTPEEVIGKMNISQLVCPEHLEKAKQMMAEKLKDPAPTVYEIDVIAKDGRRLTFEVSTRISYENGAPALVEGIARDITERKQAEKEKALLAEQIENQKKRLQALVSSVPGVVWEAWGEPDGADQRINFVSEYVQTMLGYTVEEWLSTPNFWLEIVHPEDREAAARHSAENFAGGRSGINRFRWMTKDGRAVWVESQSVVLRDENGKPVGMRGVTMDISERRKKELAEKFLSEASTALASSLEYETTLATVAGLAVPGFADWCAVDIADETGRTLQRLAVAHANPEKIRWAHEIYCKYPPDPNDPNGIYQVLKTGKSQFYPEIPEELLRQSARDEEHLEIMLQVGIRSALTVPLKVRGNVLGVITFVTAESGRHFTSEDLLLAEDLASRAALAIDNARLFRVERETRRAVERTSDFLTRLHDVSTSLSQALTPEEVTRAVIEQAAKTLGAYAGIVVRLCENRSELEIVNSVGFSREIINRWQKFDISEQVPIADAARTGKAVFIGSMEAFHEEYPMIGPLASITGSKALAALPMIVKEQIIGAMGFSFLETRNFTEDDRAFMMALAYQCAQAFERANLYENERRLRRQAETASRMKDEFLATVSHELRTPLNAIVGWANILSSHRTDPEISERAVETITRNAHAQAQIIEDILDVSRIITGKLSLKAAEIELTPVIETALESIKPAARTRDIRLVADFAPEPMIIWGDADRLQQILWNLLSNAVKFTPPGGEVRISLRETDSGAQIQVSDTGQGIEPEFLPFVFDRFSQADATTARKFGGLGLGLAIVRHLVEMHGGSVRAESEGAGRGAVLTVNLPQLSMKQPQKIPISLHGGEEVSAYADFSQSLEGISLLVVEDDADSRALLVTVLESAGAEVLAVDSAASALDAMKDFKPRVLISDIGMPGEDGFSLIRRVRENEQNGERIPAIALTAYARDEDRQKSLDAGFHKHLAKPFDSVVLVSAIIELAENK